MRSGGISDHAALTRRSFLLTVVILSFVAFTALAEPVAFPGLKRGTTVDVDDFYMMTSSKYVFRKLYEGGPIAQPDHVYLVEPEDKDLTSIRKLFIPSDTKVDVLGGSWVTADDRVKLEDLFRKIIDGKIALPLIFKPNNSAFGTGIFYVEAASSGGIVVTIGKGSLLNKAKLLKSKSLDQYFKDFGISDVKPVRAKQIIQVELSANKRAAVRQFKAIHCLMSTKEQGGRLIYDPGMFESAVTAFLVEGNAFETRHFFRGDLATGAFETATGRTRTSFNRVGNSRYFSNAGGLSSRASEYGDDMYKLLYKGFRIPRTRQAEFRDYVSRMFAEQFGYLRKRLVENGIPLADEAGQIHCCLAHEFSWRSSDLKLVT